MTLSTDQLNTMKRLHSEQHLIEITNPEDGTATAIDQDVLEAAVDQMVSWFNRRGYSIAETDFDVLANANLFARAQWFWSPEEEKQYARLQEQYPKRAALTQCSSVTLNSSLENERKEFTDDALDALDNIRAGRTTRGHPRGNA